MFKSRIVNYSRNAERRFVFDLNVAYGTDLTMARQLALDTLQSLPFVLRTPAADVWISDLGDSTVTLRLGAWIAQDNTSFARARGEAMRLSLAAFDAAGIEMPEPTYRLITDSRIAPSMSKSPPRPAANAAPAHQIEDVQVKAEMELERMVNQERKELQDGDLLKREAPEE